MILEEETSDSFYVDPYGEKNIDGGTITVTSINIVLN